MPGPAFAIFYVVSTLTPLMSYQRRLSSGQVSKTPDYSAMRSSPARLIPNFGTTPITFPKATSRVAVTRLSYTATRSACAGRCQVRQFSLAPLRPFGAPQQPTCGQRFYGRPQPLGGTDYPHHFLAGFPVSIAFAISPVGPFRRRPNQSNTFFQNRRMGSKGELHPQRPVVAAPAHFYARGFSSLHPWQGSLEPSGSLASCRGASNPRQTSNFRIGRWQARAAVHECRHV